MTADELARFMHKAAREWGEAHGRSWADWDGQTQDFRDIARAIAEAVLAELGRPAPLVVDVWTREPPKADGCYWFRWIYSREPEVVLVRGGYARFPGSERAHDTDEMPGEWAGPILPPGGSESP